MLVVRRRHLIVLLLLSSVTRSMIACVCPGIPSLSASSLNRSYAVFEGTVVAKRVHMEWHYNQFVPIVTSTFAAERVWKGNRTARIDVLEGLGSCAGRFSAGSTYLVVADGYDPISNKLFASACSPTFRIRTSRAARINRTFGPPVAEFRAIPKGSRPGVDAALYRLRAYLVSGLSVVANLIAHAAEADPFGNKWDSPPGYIWPARSAWICVAISGAGVVGAFVFGTLAIARRRRRRGMLGFLSASFVWAVASVMAAGYVYAEYTSAKYTLAWQHPERSAESAP